MSQGFILLQEGGIVAVQQVGFVWTQWLRWAVRIALSPYTSLTKIKSPQSDIPDKFI